VAECSPSRAVLSSSLSASGEAAQPTPTEALDNVIFDAASSVRRCTSQVDVNPFKFPKIPGQTSNPIRTQGYRYSRLYPIMEYKPLCRERDEIRVISIKPSKSYSSGRKTDNSWTPYIHFGGRDFPCVPAVRIALAEDLVHCRLEHVSLKDTVDRYQ
jgi:hypothetical protein